MANFFFGLLIVIVGWLISYYAKQIEDWFWEIRWAEENLGWTSNLYWLVGFGLIVLGFMVMFWVVRLK